THRRSRWWHASRPSALGGRLSIRSDRPGPPNAAGLRPGAWLRSNSQSSCDPWFAFLREQLRGRVHHSVRGDAELLHDRLARRRSAETIDPDRNTVRTQVAFPPQGRSRFDRDARQRGGTEHGGPIVGILTLEQFPARETDHADALSRSLESIRRLERDGEIGRASGRERVKNSAVDAASVDI